MYLQQRRYLLKGCLIPFVVLVLIYVSWLFRNWRQTFYIQEIGMYVRIDRIPFCDVKMSFSKDKKFGDDYVKYENTSDIVYLDVYYVPSCTICVSGASYIKQNQFHIIEYEKKLQYRKRIIKPGAWIPDYYDEYSDSTFLKNPSYRFCIYDYFSGFSLETPEGKTIFKAGIER